MRSHASGFEVCSLHLLQRDPPYKKPRPGLCHRRGGSGSAAAVWTLLCHFCPPSRFWHPSGRLAGLARWCSCALFRPCSWSSPDQPLNVLNVLFVKINGYRQVSVALLGTSNRLHLRDDHDQHRTGPKLSYKPAVVSCSELVTTDFQRVLRFDRRSQIELNKRAFEMIACKPCKLNNGYGDKSAANQNVPLWRGAECGEDGFQGGIQASKPSYGVHSSAAVVRCQSILALWAESCQLQQLSPETHAAIVSCNTGALVWGPTNSISWS